MVVLDTAVLIYWTLDPDRLSPSMRNEIDEADQIVVSSISIWEIALKVKRRKLDIPIPMIAYVERLQRLDRLEILPVDVQTWLDTLELDWEHKDPADRIIVAIAARMDCLLITSDRVIASFYPKSVW